MKRLKTISIVAILAVIVPLSVAAERGKILIAYFSWSGNTRTVAEAIAGQTKGDLFEIVPVVPYPTEYTPCTQVALQERDNNARPAIKDKVNNWDDYDVIFIGCPVWWHEAPMIIHTFAESYDFTGKTVVPFCTYASTYRDETLAKIVEITPAANHLEGFGTSGANTRGVAEWLDRIGMLPSENEAPEAVDLGLSVKWAPFNIGATKAEEYGGLYGWGDPSGSLTTTDLADYPSATPPAAICGTQYDIATAAWGEGWRMPTQAECEELASQCTWEWTQLNGVNGMKVNGTNGNSIFLPAAGSRTGSTVSGQVGQRGCYWSGTLWPDNADFASYLYFYSDACNVQASRSNRRYVGMSVRAVSSNGGSGVTQTNIGTDDLDVKVYGNTVNTAGLDPGTVILIYDATGKLVYRGSESQIALENKGVYLLRADNRTKKIRI